LVAPQSYNDALPSDTCLLEPDTQEVLQTLQYVAKISTMNASQGLIGSYIARKH
jgi:hypothetical protein